MSTNEVIEGEALELISGQELSLESHTEIDIQISTARRYPRSISNFQKEALSMATVNVETAQSCYYTLLKGGNKIEGPSIRLAEIAGSSWGNIRYGARVVREERDFVVAQGSAFDLEKNVAMTIEVKRRITTKDGKRYTSDMIAQTANAACARLTCAFCARRVFVAAAVNC